MHAGVPHIHIPIAIGKLSTQTSEHPQASQCLFSGEDPKLYKHIQDEGESMTCTNVEELVCDSACAEI